MAETGATGWVRLTFTQKDRLIPGTDSRGRNRLFRDRFLVVSYADSRGRRAEAPRDADRWGEGQPFVGSSELLAEVKSRGVVWPTAATRYLFDLIEDTPIWREPLPYGSGPVSIAVLVVPAAKNLASAVYEHIASGLLETLGLGRQKYSIAMEAAWTGVPKPFTLPFDIGYAAPGEARFRQFVRRLLSSLDPKEREHAIRVNSVPLPELRRRAANFDIVVTSGADLAALLVGPGRPRRGPRLIIADDLTSLPPMVNLRHPPIGTSLIGVPFPAGSSQSRKLIEEIIRGFTHDLPLHEAVVSAARKLGLAPEVRARIRVVTTVSGLESLRLQSAYEHFEVWMQDLVRFNGFERLTVPGIITLPRDLDFGRISAAIGRGRQVRSDFRRESAGLSEMARAAMARQEAHRELEALSRLGADLASDKRRLADLARQQSRRVSIWLTHASHEWGQDRMHELARHTVLGQRRRYLLNVGAGIMWPTDLLDVATPPLDPILPPTDDATQEIEVAVFSDSVKIIGPRSKPLALSRIGPAGPVTFEIETGPRRRRAQLRVLLYHRRHILQAFSIEMRLAPTEGWSSEGEVLSARTVYSRRAQLRDIDDLPERAMAIAVNANRGGSHLLMFDGGYAVTLSEKLVSDSLESSRNHLARAFAAAKGTEQLDTKNLRALITALANIGYDLWDHIDTQLPQAANTRLAALRNESGTVVQILRVQPEFAFPWAMLYDWDLPETPAALEAAALCLGVNDGAPCECTPEQNGVVCVRGFWGIRHVIEELVRNEDADEHIAQVVAATDAPPVLCTVGIDNDRWSVSMVNALEDALGRTQVDSLTPKRSLLDTMWNPAVRPAVLVVLGHLTEKVVAHEAPFPRIYVKASERYLYANALTKKRRARGCRWDAPQRPVVLLLACDSAQEALGKVHSFVARLANVGASAIIATEERIDTRLAAGVATAIVAGLGTVGPGESLRRWRAEQLSRRNPFGFLFTCFGSSDVTVAELGSAHAGELVGATT